MITHPKAMLFCIMSIVSIVVAVVAKTAIETVVGPGPPLIYFVPAVTFSAWLGGAVPGLLAVGVSTVVCCFAYFPPIGSFAVASHNDQFRLFVFWLQGTMVSVLMEQLHRARRRAETYGDMLSRSEGQLRDLMDKALAVVFIKDSEGRYVMANRHFEVLFGSEGRPVVGHTDLELFPLHLAEKYRSDDLEVRATNQPIQCEDIGQLEDGQHTYLTVKFPLRDRDGACYAVGGFSTDITQRKRVEAVNALLASIVDSSDDAIIGKDLDGNISSWNAAAERLFGYSADEAVGRSITLIIPPDRMDEEAEILREVRRNQPVKHYETVRRRKDGTLLDISLTVSPVRDSKGQVIGASKIARDITERKRISDALARSSERLEGLTRQLLRTQEDERRRIARELHDEIGQALSALKINHQRMARCKGGNAMTMVENVAIIDQLLKQIRGMALDLRPCILDDLGMVPALDWYVARHAQRAGLDGRFLADPEQIRADPEIETVCFRVAQEALTNVARHARATRFRVELLQHDRGIALVVRDDGVGFDPDAMIAASRWTSSGLGGMRERVELVGGRIEVVSEPGGGTEVRVDLPNIPLISRVDLVQEA